jgi:tetratricopeptide (TPR) repeat protein
MGRVEEAAAEHQRAITIDPPSLIDNTNVADGYYAAGQFQKAIEPYRKTLELDPNFDVASFGLGHAYAQLGMWREAVEAWQKGRRLLETLALPNGWHGHTPKAAMRVHCRCGLPMSWRRRTLTMFQPRMWRWCMPGSKTNCAPCSG